MADIIVAACFAEMTGVELYVYEVEMSQFIDGVLPGAAAADIVSLH